MLRVLILGLCALSLVGLTGCPDFKCQLTKRDLLPYVGPTCNPGPGCACAMDPDTCDAVEVCVGSGGPVPKSSAQALGAGEGVASR